MPEFSMKETVLNSSRHLRRSRALFAIGVVVALAAAGCSSGASKPTGSGAVSTVNIGLEAALTGVYKPVGTDLRDGFQLYLAGHGGKLGGHPVNLIVGDEGTGAATAVPVAQKMIADDHLLALTGLVAGDSVAAISHLTTKANIPLIGSNARPNLPDISSLWTTSFMSADPGTAIAPYIKSNVSGPVYAIGPDYQGGYDEVNGFTDAFAKAGGQLANPGGKTTWTPWPTTTDFSPYLAKIAASGAKAIYCFYAGGDAIGFVKQWAQSDAKNIPLYSAGFLTEGGVLQAEGPAATGVTGVLNYAPDADTATNRAFVAAWSKSHNGAQPTTFAMASYDAAAVLDQAIAKAGADPTAQTVNAALGTLGQIDSPRGTWQFGSVTHAPVQQWYLRKVVLDGSVLANVKIQNLATLGS